ncbi:N-acetylmuramoyl-L-alanine amidase [Bacillus ectoiniformans]|uniref:N-acetylmuramoyl-L-alanine amidase CwlD n=1 Tax=Bacillus ectoiniformans TaxID=1494429 RepID=UPI00195A2E5C|nr:N-acetylmuramoyl-L-alanine amidase CwlD [Bacillus ectoiniformans]MBM7650551.1 N-acetylmuramoyl-L-alanine amidase [Bacillus ectoiniformans]
MGKLVKLVSICLSGIMLIILFQYSLDDKESWKSWNMPLSGKVIYLDPGHGGVDGGAGDEGGLEKDIALAVTSKIRDYLQEQGAIVLMTREEDVDLAARETKGYSVRKAEDLKKRLHLINDSDADLYLSIHLNAIPSPRWRGAQTFFSPNRPENKEIAKAIQDEIVLNLENTDRLAKPIQHVYLLKYANKPGALVEIGFLSNPEEKRDLVSEEYQDMMAAAIYKGILRYLDGSE